MGVGNLLLKEVLLIEEEDDRGVLEPRICDYRPEKRFTLLHTILRRKGWLVSTDSFTVNDQSSKSERSL